MCGSVSQGLNEGVYKRLLEGHALTWRRASPAGILQRATPEEAERVCGSAALGLGKWPATGYHALYELFRWGCMNERQQGWWCYETHGALS
jgi:hypothetical protein